MPLEVEIYGKNMDVTDRLNDYVNKKVSKLNRKLNGIDDARVDLSYVKSARSASDRQVAQITVRGKGFLLRTEERADDIFAALDTAIDKMERQIERYKGKRNRGRGDGRSAAEVVAAPVAESEMEGEGEEASLAIVRRKQFQVAPMDEEEAIEQMSLLGHESFFVFFNVNTNKMSVLYKRRDGTFGLIEPEIG